MGLLLLGGIQREDLLRLPAARSRSLGSLWRRTEETYFIGTTTRDLKAILHPFGKLIDTHVCRKEHMARTLATLRQAGIAIINIETATMSHWVLAIGMVGIESRAGFQVSRLLILDPSHSPIALAAWNATLSVRPDRQDRHRYETPEGRQLVSVGAVLTLRKRAPAGQ